MERIILTYGTFDLFHVGHLRILERLRGMGDKLMVGVSTDEFNKIKGKSTIIRYADRAAIVGALKCVDGVFPENDWDQKIDDVKRLGVAVFGMGDDWAGKFDFLENYCQVVYLPRTEGVSSTDLKRVLNVLSKSHIEELKTALDIISGIVKNFES